MTLYLSTPKECFNQILQSFECNNTLHRYNHKIKSIFFTINTIEELIKNKEKELEVRFNKNNILYPSLVKELEFLYDVMHQSIPVLLDYFSNYLQIKDDTCYEEVRNNIVNTLPKIIIKEMSYANSKMIKQEKETLYKK